MRLNDHFPSAHRQRGILFVPVTDLIGQVAYIDGKSIDRFVAGVDVLLRCKVGNLALSFKGISHVNSSAISYLCHLHEKLEARGEHLLVYELSPKVKVVLAELGLDRHFDIYGLKGHIFRYFEGCRPDGPEPEGGQVAEPSRQKGES